MGLGLHLGLGVEVGGRGRRDLAQLPVRVRPGLRVSGEHVLPPPLPVCALEGVFLGDRDRLQVGPGLWLVRSCHFVSLGLPREPRKKGPLQVAQEELWTRRQRWGPRS